MVQRELVNAALITVRMAASAAQLEVILWGEVSSGNHTVFAN